MTRVFLAASLDRRAEMAEHAAAITKAGGRCVSSWVADVNDAATPQLRAEVAMADLRECSGVLLFADGGRRSTEEHEWFGFGAGLNKWLWLIGDRHTALASLGRVTEFPDFRSWLAYTFRKPGKHGRSSYKPWAAMTPAERLDLQAARERDPEGGTQ